VITALSEGRGYGEAGGEGLFSSCQISESLTHPPRREGVRQLGRRSEAIYSQLVAAGHIKFFV